MTRSEFERLYGKPEIAPCKRCEGMISNQRRRQLARRRYQKTFADALTRGIESGKVIRVWDRDEFTGWHYIDYKGRCGLTGRGNQWAG